MPENYTNRFEIEFDTETMPGRVIATQVTLTSRVMGPKDVAQINLSDHPLYRQLWRYCRNNPPRKDGEPS